MVRRRAGPTNLLFWRLSFQLKNPSCISYSGSVCPLTCIDQLMDPEWTPNLATLQARLQEETQQRTHEELSLRVTIDGLEMGLAENERRHQEFQANVQARLAEETHQRESGESSLWAGLGGLRSALVHIQRNQDQMQIEMAQWQHVQVRSLQDSGSDREAGDPVENSTTEQGQRNKTSTASRR